MFRKYLDNINFNSKLFKNNYLIFLFIASIPSIFPLLRKGFISTEDGTWMVIRFSAFYRSLLDGQIPVRFIDSLNFNYGYPVANFLYPAFMYLATPFKFVGFSSADSIKIILIISMMGSLYFTYFWLHKIFSSKSAFLGALIYLYLPYHLYDLYVRGSVGEILSLMFLPFCLWAIEKKSLWLLSVGVFFILISHNSLAVFFLPIIFIYSIMRRNNISIRYLFSAYVIGMMLAAFFIIPAIWDLKYTIFNQVEISDIKNYFPNLRMIGFLGIIVPIIYLGLVVKNIFQKNKIEKLPVLFAFLSFFVLFFTSYKSYELWKILPNELIQFPFRLLSIHILSIAFLASYLFQKLNKNFMIIIFISIVFILAIGGASYIKNVNIDQREEGFYSTNQDTTTVKDEYMPIWVDKDISIGPDQRVEIVEGEGTISELVHDTKATKFSLELESSSLVRINKIYFPGWELIVDGESKEVLYNESGLIEFKLDKGQYMVSAEFNETNLRSISNLLSILGFMFLIFLFKKNEKFIN